MAVITKIGGVATSGTSGVNNVFGSGTTGSSSPTATPTVLLSSTTSFGGNSLLVTNYGSATNYGQLRLDVVQNVGGVNITPEITDYTIQVQSGIAVVLWEDTTTYTGQYDVTVYMVDMDSNPAEVTSNASTTVSYTKTAPKFRYYRVMARAANGASTGNNLAVSDMQLFASPNAIGTQYTGINNFYQEYMTDYTTGRDDMVALSGYNFNTYHGWKAFDNGTGIGNAWWSLIIPANRHADNYTQLEWQDQSQNASSRWATSADFPEVSSIRVRTETNGNATHMELMGSDTGAFAGEEHSYGLQSVTTGSYQIFNA